MTKTIVSTIALIWILQGCGSSSNNNNSDSSDTQSHSVSPTVSEEIKSFASSVNKSDEVLSVIKETSTSQASSSKTENKNKIYQKETINSCEGGGTQKIISDIDFDNNDIAQLEQMTNDSFKVKLIMDECIEDGEKSNATISLVVKGNNLSDTTITFLEESTFEELESAEVITVSKNSTITISEISDDSEKVTTTIKAVSSTGERYETIDLVAHETMNENSDSMYEISGKVVHNGITYRVDEQYDSSKTPMVYENHENLISGTSKYYNEENHHVTITVIDKNRIKISVDTDNDGIVDEEESIDL
jgi:hypothetical protein